MAGEGADKEARKTAGHKTLQETMKGLLKTSIPPGLEEGELRERLMGDKPCPAVKVMAIEQLMRALGGDLRAVAFIRELTEEEEVSGAGETTPLEELIRLLEEA